MAQAQASTAIRGQKRIATRERGKGKIQNPAVQESICEMSEGNNKRILDYFANRLDIGNVKFGKEMPADGTYDVEDALEEAIDMVAYLIVCLFHLKDKMDDV